MKKRPLSEYPKWNEGTRLRAIRLNDKKLAKECRPGETLEQARLRLLREARRLENEACEEWKRDHGK